MERGLTLWPFPLSCPPWPITPRDYDLPQVQLPHQALWQQLGKQGPTPWCGTSSKATHGWQSQRILVASGVKTGGPRACVPSSGWRGASGCQAGESEAEGF